MRKYLGWRKSRPFTEEQIQAKAYEIWERRDRQGTSEENWQAAIAELKRERSRFGNLHHLWQTATHKDNRNFSLEVAKVAISAFGVLATIFAGVGLYLTYRNSQEQLEAARQDRQINSERLITDRFAKAVEQLGSQDIHVRMGAIYSLERIAKDSPKDHWTVMEVLTAYVRNKSPLPEGWFDAAVEKRKLLPPIKTDVRSALTVISRREAKNDPKDKRLNLSESNLRGANFSGSNLDRANFSGSNLYDASLDQASLSGALLRGTNLDRASLYRADLNSVMLGRTIFVASLRGASFKDAHLLSANFSGADLRDADLRDANLDRANLYDASLDRANLSGAKKITPDQIKQADNWQQAQYSDDFRKQLGLPPEK